MKHWRIGEESLHDSTQSPHGVETMYVFTYLSHWSLRDIVEIMSLVLKCPTNNTVSSHCKVWWRWLSRFFNERLIGHTFFTLTKQRVGMKLRWMWVYYFDFDFPNWTLYLMHSLVPKPLMLKVNDKPRAVMITMSKYMAVYFLLHFGNY